MTPQNKNTVVQIFAQQSGINYEINGQQIDRFSAQLIEHCARLAEQQAGIYTGEKNEGAGCYRAALVLRAFNSGMAV